MHRAGARRSRPRPRGDHRLRAGDDPPRRDQVGRVHRAAGHARSGWSSPRPASSPSRATTTFTVVGYFKSGMSEYDSTHVYVPLERLQEMRLPGRRAGPRRGQPDPDQGQAGRRPRRARRTAPDGARAAPADVLPGLDLGAEAGPAPGGGRDRAEHPEHAPVLHHRRGRVRHPGDLLDDRRREDPRHRRHEGARGLDGRASGGSSSATACCWGWSAAASAWSAACCSSTTSTTIEKWLSKVTGRKVFDDSIYYFDEIPTLVEPWTVGLDRRRCAVHRRPSASIWPAQRAARLHPVRALRFE